MSNSKKIILIDSITSIEEINKELTNYSGVKIITFDYHSHYILKENNIEHIVSDEYLKNDMLEKINEASFRLTKWFEGEIQNSLLYDSINLGSIFYSEFHHYLLQELKKIFEVKIICNELKELQVIATEKMARIVKYFLKNSIINIENSNGNKEFLDDKIKYRISNTTKLELSKETYTKLKKYSEKIFTNLYSKNKTENQKTVMFIEFDPIKFEKLLINSKVFSFNCLLYNRRRPSIWNLKSFKIIKKSKWMLGTEDSILNESLGEKIREDQKHIEKNINCLWNKEKFFDSFFMFDGISFWSLIKENFVELCLKRMREGVKEICVAREIIKKYKITSIVCWSESGFNEQIVIGLAKKMNCRVFLLQHGLYVDSNDSFSQNEFSGVLPTISDNFLAWGEVTKKYMMNAQLKQPKIEIIGNPSYDSIYEHKDEDIIEPGQHILIATTSTSNKIGDFLTKNKEEYEKTIQTICEILNKMQKKIIIKTHPFEEEEYLTKLVKIVNPEIKVIKKGSIIPLIKSCEVFISIDMSTTILESQLLKKPVITINTGKVPFNNDSVIFKSNSCDRIKIDDFEKTIRKIIDDKQYRNDLIQRGTDFLNNYVSNLGESSHRFLLYLQQF